MSVATAPRHRTRKNALNTVWEVQVQSVTRLWHTVGSVRLDQKPSRAPLHRGHLTTKWEAAHRGIVLGYFDTKREAVQTVVDAESRLGS